VRHLTHGDENLCEQLGRRRSLRRREVDLDARRLAHRLSFAGHEVEREPRVRLGEAIERAAMDGGRVLAAADLSHADVAFTANVRGDLDATVEAELLFDSPAVGTRF